MSFTKIREMEGNSVHGGLTAALMDELEELYLHGRYLEAYERSTPLGPLAKWRGTAQRILAAKLARMLGNTRLAEVLLYLAWREERGSPRAFGYYARNHFGRNGLLKTLRLVERYAQFFDDENVPPELPAFRAFLYDRVYDNPEVHNDFDKASKILKELYGYMVENRAWFMEELAQPVEGATLEELVGDFIAGMTDRYAINLYEKLFMPQPWKVL